MKIGHAYRRQNHACSKENMRGNIEWKRPCKLGNDDIHSNIEDEVHFNVIARVKQNIMIDIAYDIHTRYMIWIILEKRCVDNCQGRNNHYENDHK